MYTSPSHALAAVSCIDVGEQSGARLLSPRAQQLTGCHSIDWGS